MQELQKYREEIDKLDSEIISLLASRFEIVQKVWEFKKKNNMPALQNWRWQEVVDSRKKQALEKWISQDFIEKIWNEIHDYALYLEK